MTSYLLDKMAPEAGGRFAGLWACYDQSGEPKPSVPG
jgi:hypothetical protein